MIEIQKSGRVTKDFKEEVLSLYKKRLSYHKECIAYHTHWQELLEKGIIFWENHGVKGD